MDGPIFMQTWVSLSEFSGLLKNPTNTQDMNFGGGANRMVWGGWREEMNNEHEYDYNSQQKCMKLSKAKKI